jgi:hypothetical protein
MRIIHFIPFLLLIACPLMLGFAYIQEVIAVDSALDAGASWDYALGRADFVQSHPFIPFTERHKTFVVVAMVSLASALGYLVLLLTILRARKVQ